MRKLTVNSGGIRKNIQKKIDIIQKKIYMYSKRNSFTMRGTSDENLPSVIDREYWHDYTLFLAVSSEMPHYKLSTVRPAIIANGTYIMNGYEYSLLTSIYHSERAGKVARDSGHTLADIVPFRSLKAARRECIYAFF